MQGTIAQVIALTTYGNAFVGGAPAFDVSSFYPIACNQPTQEPQAIDMYELKTRLADNLAAIGNFARTRKLEGFSKAFDAGLAQLNAQDPYKGDYHGDLAPDRALPLAAAQLLGAAQAAWVFGGMGSWNDLWFEGDDQSLYERLSEDLYQLLNAAIVTAANTSAPSIPATRRRPWWKL